MSGDGRVGRRRRLYGIASAIVLNVDSWISLTYSGAIERKQVAENAGVREGAIVINAADAAFCSASGQCSHFQKSPPKFLQIPAGLCNPFKSFCYFLSLPLFLDHHLFLTSVLHLIQHYALVLCFFCIFRCFP